MDISVIIPTYNRDFLLKKTIASLLVVDYPASQFEVLIMDNASTDSTREIVEGIVCSNQRYHFKHIYVPEPGLLSGRHRGAKEAKSDLLVFIDDDIEVNKGWLLAIFETFKNSKVCIVGGRSLPYYELEQPPWLNLFWTYKGEIKMCAALSLIDFGEKCMNIDPRFIWGLNFAIRKQTLFDLGGFHPDCLPKHLQRYQGDGETGLSFKAKQRGIVSAYQPKAVVHHHIPRQRLTLEYFQGRFFYQGVCMGRAHEYRKIDLFWIFPGHSDFMPRKMYSDIFFFQVH